VEAYLANALFHAHRDATACGYRFLADKARKLYPCTVKDVFSNHIIGYSIDTRMKSRIAVNTLNNAVDRSGDVAGCAHHPDRGSQFRSRMRVRGLNCHSMVRPIGRVCAAEDNASMEMLSSARSRRTSLTARSRPPAGPCALRSSPESSGPTTDPGDKLPSAD
jgi:transposase InsO family protein